MKKSVSFCLLSILVAMFITVGAFLTPAQAQETQETPCCLWLENTDPPTPYELTTLEHHLSTSPQQPVDTFIIHFPDCGIAGTTKVSLSWEIYENGVLLEGLNRLNELSYYADVKFVTYYARADQFIDGGIIDGGIPTLYPPVVDDNNYKDYPGATNLAPGYFTLAGVYSLDYFRYGFLTFPTTEVKMIVKWRSVGDYKIVLNLMERQGGDDYYSDYCNYDQNLYVGGHQSHITGNILASFVLKPIHTSAKDAAICFGEPFTFGNPPIEFTTDQDSTPVLFYNPDCPEILDSLVYLTLDIYDEIPAPEVEDVEYCLNAPAVPLVATVTDEDYFLEWSTDNIVFEQMENPTPETDIAGTTTYYVRQAMIDEFETYCYGEATITVTVHPLPATPVAEVTDYEYCVGGEASAIEVSGTEGYTLEYSTDSVTFSTTAPVPSTETAAVYTYYVRQINDETKCISAEYLVITVTVYDLPEVRVSAVPDTICVGKSSVLTATGADSYAWSHDLEITAASVTVSPVTTTTYTVTGTENHDLVSCTNTARVEVVVNPLPVVEDVTLTATVGTYSDVTPWTVSGTFGDGFSMCLDPEVEAPSFYYLDIDELTSNIALKENHLNAFTLDQTALPTNWLSYWAAKGVIAGATGWQGAMWNIINGDEPAFYLYYTGTDYQMIDGMQYLVSASMSPLRISGDYPEYTYIYTGNVTATTGCVSEDFSVNMTFHSIPTPTITGEDTVCAGETVTYTTEPGMTDYVWTVEGGTGTSTTNSIYVTWGVGGTGTVSVQYTGPGACVSKLTSIPVTINPSPVISFGFNGKEASATVNEFEYCYSDTVIVTLFNTYSGTAPYKVTYNIDGGSSTTVAGLEIGGILGVQTLVPGTYIISVTAIEDANGCQATADFLAICKATVIVHPMPKVEITSDPETTICAKDTITLTATAIEDATYLWSYNSLTTAEITLVPETTTTYYVTVTSKQGCTAVASITITVNPLPVVTYDFQPNDTICSGTDLKITAYAGSPTGYFYNWLISSQTGPILNITPINYNGTPITKQYIIYIENTITLCSLYDTVPVVVIPAPKPEITASNDIICSDTSAVLTAGTWNAYTWSTGSHEPSIVVNTQGFYSVTVTDANGCQGVDTFYLTVNPVPVVEITTNPSAGVVCNGQTVLVTANTAPGMSYLWDNGQTVASFTTPTLINNGNSPITHTYTVIVTNNTTLCTVVESVTITVNPRPDAAIVNLRDTICSGDALELTADDNTKYSDTLITTSYLWSPNTGYTDETPITVNPISTITYSLTATNSYGCTGTTNATIFVNSLPIPEITGNAAICTGVITNVLSVSEIYTTYEWGFGGETLEGKTTPTINAVEAGTYLVTVTDANGCMGIDEFELTVNPLPEFTLTIPEYDDAACSGVEVTIIADSDNDGLVYEWSTGATGASIDTVLVNSGTYTFYVTATDPETGCEKTDSISVTVNALPLAEITSDATGNAVCEGEEVTLTATGGVEYAWSDDALTGAVNTFTPAETATYFVTVTNSDGCTAVASITITVNPLPEFEIEMNPENGEICFGDDIILTATGEYTYLWNTGATTSEITVSPVSDSTYTVTATTELGCTATATVSIIVNPLPVITLTAADTTICIGSTAVISAEPEGLTYVWGDNSTGAIFDTVLNVAGNHAFTVTGTDNTTGCEATASMTITVNDIPAPDLTITHTKKDICLGESVTLSGPDGYKYTWAPGGATTQEITVSPNEGTHLYTLTILDETTGCTNSAIDTIHVHGLPDAAIEDDRDLQICKNDTITLTAIGGATYLWLHDNSTEASIKVAPTTTTEYTVVVYNEFLCSDTARVTVTVDTLPNVTITSYKEDNTICFGDTITLTASGADTYEWNDLITVNPRTVSPAETTIYTVTGTNGNGCTAIATVTVTVNKLPEITFTVDPNDTVCLNTMVTITANAPGTGMSYEWSTGAETAAIDTLLAEAGDFTFMVTATDNAGCANSSSLTITVLGLPSPEVIILPESAQICFGKDITLSGPDGYAYNWSTEDTTKNITVAPTTTRDYTLTITDPATTCQNSATVTVTVEPLPEITFTIVPNDTICSGTDIIITANAGPNKRYNWLLTSQTGPKLHATPLNNNSVPKTEIFIVEATDTVTGCIVIDTQLVVVMPLPHVAISTNNNDTICEGQSTVLDAGSGFIAYEWSVAGEIGQTLEVSESGTYYVTVTDPYGCESDTNIYVQVNPVPDITLNPSPNDTVCNGANIQIQASAGSGMSYVWSTGATSNIITLNNLTNLTDTIVTYKYTVTVTNTVTGCTASETQTIVVNPTPLASIITLTDTICYGESITLTADDARNYTVTTTYVWSTGSTAIQLPLPSLTVGNHLYGLTATNAYGCSNATSVTITVHPSYEHVDAVTICDNELPFNYGDSTFAEGTISGNYPVHFTLATGCDSLVTVNLTVNPTYKHTDTLAICANQLPYEDYGDTTFAVGTVSGDYPVMFSTVDGCDSLVTLNLTVNPTYKHTDTLSICDNKFPYSYGDSTFNAAGTYEVMFETVNGCDSLVTLTLTVNPTYEIPIFDTICDNDSLLFNEEFLKLAGTYYDTLLTQLGCDSVIKLTLTVNPTYSRTDEVIICASELPYTYGDSIFAVGTVSDDYEVMFKTVNGCDSLITLTLTVNPTYNHTDTLVICASALPYTYGDSIFAVGTLSDNYEVMFKTVNDCDSLVTLTLTVNPIYSHTDTLAICDNELPYDDYGDTTFAVGTVSGNYPVMFSTVNGCDSLVTLTLTVNPTYELPIFDTICDNEFPYIYGDSTFTAAGTYDVMFKTVNGCDSVMTLTLTVNLTFETPIDTSICINDSLLFNGEYLKVAGTYYDTLSTQLGCDSVIILTLTLDTLPVVAITGDDRACTGPIVLTATDNPGFTYAWDGEGTSFGNNIFNATATDTVWVTVTDENGCKGTASHSLVIDPDVPYMDIYVKNYETGVVAYTDNALVGGVTNFDIVVNTCSSDSNVKVSIEYKVYRNDVLISTNMAPYVTTNSSISYDVNNTYNADQDYFLGAIDRYHDINSIGSIPTGESNDPLTDRTYRLTFGGTNYDFEWFWLHFLNGRPISVQIANWAQPGEYRFEYTLVTRQSVDNWFLPYHSPNLEIGGHNAGAILDTLAFRTITVTVEGPETIFILQESLLKPLQHIEEPLEVAALDIYPNPNNINVVNLKLNNMEGKTVVKIVNMSGKVIETHDLNLSSKGENIVSYSLSDYAQGIYFVTVINNDAVLTKKLIIQK